MSQLLRRNVLRIGIALAFAPACAAASADSGFYVLDTPAIAVRRPNRVFLEAVTLAGARLIAVGEHGVIIVSDDCGSSWRQAAVPVDVTLNCVAFATPLIGWAAGHFGVILQTRDGGLTWQTQLNGVRANQLTMAAAQTASTDHPTSPGAPYAVRRANIFMQGGPNKPFLTLVAISPRKVIVFGAFRMTMVTNDGGATWTDGSLSVDDRLSHNLYAAVIAGSGIYVAGEAGEVFRSSDGGNTFPAVTSPAAVTFFGVLVADDDSILIFGVAGNLFRSTDRGQTWQEINLNTEDDLTAGLVAKSGNIFIATEAGAAFFSKDNGASFSPLLGAPPMAIFDIAEAPDGNLIFVGDAGAVRISFSALKI
jgi:photosystem II stability/assembly factor-like uncharacterized protein